MAKTKEEKQKQAALVWVSENRGILSRIAKEAGSSIVQVSLILHGKRRGSGPIGTRVVDLLKKAGAPMPCPIPLKKKSK